MVIVAGHATVEPHQREAYLAESGMIVEQARRMSTGCLDVAVSADLIDPRRVNIFERWESQAVLETFRRNSLSNQQFPAVLSLSLAEYDVADVRPLSWTSTA